MYPKCDFCNHDSQREISRTFIFGIYTCRDHVGISHGLLNKYRHKIDKLQEEFDREVAAHRKVYLNIS